MKCKSQIFLFVALLTLSMCSKKENPQPQSMIGSDFKMYVDRFVSEAASRGYKIDVSQLIVTYSDTMNYYCGYGLYSSIQVLISSRSSCWQNQSDMNKEILMFHELGHAILGRSHDNTKLLNGDYKTMMFGGNQFNLYSSDTPERRKYYLDELFNPSTPAPSWASAKTNPTILFVDSISASSPGWRYVQNSGTSQTGKISSQIYLSPGSSMEIQSPSVSSNISYWTYSLSSLGINQSDGIMLTVKVKVDGLDGPGAYVALRGDSDAGIIFFATTQGTIKIAGTSDFLEYSVYVPYYIATAKYLRVFLILDPKSTGTVYFDDVTLTKYQ
jgi:hypothetical protein